MTLGCPECGSLLTNKHAEGCGFGARHRPVMGFIEWTRASRGGAAPSLHAEDPRQALSWPQVQQRSIAVFPLRPEDRRLSLDEAAVAYPCPAFEVGA